MKQIIPTLTILVVALIAAECVAQPPQRDDRLREPNAPKGRAAEGRRPGDFRGGRNGPIPAQMVARWIKEFDQDGDQKLDAKELTAMFTALRERRGASGQGPRDTARSQRGEQPGKKPRANRSPRSTGNDRTEPGGQTPKRPAAE